MQRHWSSDRSVGYFLLSNGAERRPPSRPPSTFQTVSLRGRVNKRRCFPIVYRPRVYEEGDRRGSNPRPPLEPQSDAVRYSPSWAPGNWACLGVFGSSGDYPRLLHSSPYLAGCSTSVGSSAI